MKNIDITALSNAEINERITEVKDFLDYYTDIIENMARGRTNRHNLKAKLLISELSYAMGDNSYFQVGVTKEESLIFEDDEIYDLIRFKAGHEIQHILSTTKAYEETINKIVEMWKNEAVNRGLYPQYSYILDTARSLTNGCEDGRIENIMCAYYKGLVAPRKWYRLWEWQREVVDEEWKSLSAIMWDIHSIATRGIHLQGFLDTFEGTPEGDVVEKAISHISDCVLAKTCKKGMEAVYEIATLITDYVLDGMADAETQNDMRNMSEATSSQNTDGQAEENNEQEGNGLLIAIITDDTEFSEDEDENTQKPDLVIDLRTKKNEDEKENEDKDTSNGNGASSDTSNSEDNENENPSSSDSSSGENGENSEGNSSNSEGNGEEGTDNKGNSSNSKNSKEEGADEKKNSNSSGNSGDKENKENSKDSKNISDSKENNTDKNSRDNKSKESSDSKKANKDSKSTEKSGNSDSENAESSTSNKSSSDTLNKSNSKGDEFDATDTLSKGVKLSEKELLEIVKKAMETANVERKAESESISRQAEYDVSEKRARKTANNQWALTPEEKRTLENQLGERWNDVNVAELTEGKPLSSSLRRTLEDIKNKAYFLKTEIENAIKSIAGVDRQEVYEGDIDENDIFKIAINHYDYFKQEGTPVENDMCCYILKDNSGSMGSGEGSKQDYSCRTLALLEEIYKSLMPLKMTAFDDGWGSLNHYTIKNWEDNDLDRNYAFDFHSCYDSGNGNDDEKSIMIATKELEKRPEKDKLLIVICDGQPCGQEGVKGVKKAVNYAREQGIFVVGIYISNYINDKAIEVFEDMYGKDSICVEPSEIGERLTNLMSEYMITSS